MTLWPVCAHGFLVTLWPVCNHGFLVTLWPICTHGFLVTLWPVCTHGFVVTFGQNVIMVFLWHAASMYSWSSCDVSANM